MTLQVYEQSDGSYKAMHPQQNRFVDIAFTGDDIDPDGTYHRGADFEGMEININAYVPPTPPTPPTPAENRATQYKLRCDPIAAVIVAYEMEYDITGREDLPALIAAERTAWMAERTAIRAEYPDEGVQDVS